MFGILIAESEVKKGIFVAESKNRFLCQVKIDDALVECYVPNSSRMENYLELEGKEVLLINNKGKHSRTKYSLLAVNYDGFNYILLNMNKVNRLLEYFIINGSLYSEQTYRVSREKMIQKYYKTDLFLENETNEVIVEVKGIISTGEVVKFPQVHSARSIVQLEKINLLLLEGKSVHYYLAVLGPFSKRIYLEREDKYTRMLEKCIENGLELYPIAILYDGKEFTLNQELELEFTG